MTALAAAAPAADSIVPGVLGFLVVAGMGIVLFFLLRSMNKQLRRVSGGARWQEGPGDPRAGSGPGADARSAKAQGAPPRPVKPSGA